MGRFLQTCYCVMHAKRLPSIFKSESISFSTASRSYCRTQRKEKRSWLFFMEGHFQKSAILYTTGT